MRGLRGLLFFITTLVMYLGLPLLGWGIGDLDGFFSLDQRLGYAVSIGILGLAVGYQALDDPAGIRGSKGQVDKLVRRQSVVRVVAMTLLLGGLFFLPFADRHDIGVMVDRQAFRWAGLALFGLGIGLVFWSGVALGRLYSADVTVQENHQLVTTGLYRYIRHPRYLGVIHLGLGLSMLFRSWIGLVVTLLFCGVLLLRIRDEEALMYKEFGETWTAYCRRSWRLIPFLY